MSGALAWLRVGRPWLIFLQGFGRFALTFAGNKSISRFHVIWINCYQINSHNCGKNMAKILFHLLCGFKQTELSPGNVIHS